MVRIFGTKVNRRASSLLEYGLMIGVVSFALMSMNLYVKRGLQGRLRDMTDHFIGKEQEAVATILTETTSSSTNESNAKTRISGKEGGTKEETLEPETRKIHAESTSDSYTEKGQED